jgi:hypothetical protein
LKIYILCGSSLFKKILYLFVVLILIGAAIFGGIGYIEQENNASLIETTMTWEGQPKQFQSYNNPYSIEKEGQ